MKGKSFQHSALSGRQYSCKTGLGQMCAEALKRRQACKIKTHKSRPDHCIAMDNAWPYIIGEEINLMPLGRRMQPSLKEHYWARLQKGASCTGPSSTRVRNNNR